MYVKHRTNLPSVTMSRMAPEASPHGQTKRGGMQGEET